MAKDQVVLESFDERIAFQNWLMHHYLFPFTVDSLVGIAVNRGDLSRPRDNFRFNGPDMEVAYREFKK